MPTRSLATLRHDPLTAMTPVLRELGATCSSDTPTRLLSTLTAPYRHQAPTAPAPSTPTEHTP